MRARGPIPLELAERLRAAGQEHLLRHAENLEPAPLARLIEDLEALDLLELEKLLAEPLEMAEGALAAHSLEPHPCVLEGADPQADVRARAKGLELLAAGRVAAFLVAGGQGTRLGYPGPKGCFPATPIQHKPLFKLFAEKLKARGRRAGRPIWLYVMTSRENHRATRAFFEEQDFLGLERERVRFLIQGTMPAVDRKGRLLLAAKDRLFRSPDGHGGSLKLLEESGALQEMAQEGIDLIFYFQVDNPLVKLLDPLFLGYHHLHQSSFSSKAVPKRHSGERVGVLIKQDGRTGVIEYSYLPAKLREERTPEGGLRFGAGNIAVHCLERSFVEELNQGGLDLTYHRACKHVPVFDARRGLVTLEGIKFERFVFDALPLAPRTLVMEVDRGEEFSPIKNAAGEDSLATSLDDQQALHASWLEQAGVEVARSSDGSLPFRIEISPLFADSAQELLARKSELPLHVASDLYLGED